MAKTPFIPAPARPTNWADGISHPYMTQTGEIPFLHYGKWYLYVWDTSAHDNAMYSFSEDRFYGYVEGRKVMGID